MTVTWHYMLRFCTFTLYNYNEIANAYQETDRSPPRRVERPLILEPMLSHSVGVCLDAPRYVKVQPVSMPPESQLITRVISSLIHVSLSPRHIGLTPPPQLPPLQAHVAPLRLSGAPIPSPFLSPRGPQIFPRLKNAGEAS